MFTSAQSRRCSQNSSQSRRDKRPLFAVDNMSSHEPTLFAVDNPVHLGKRCSPTNQFTPLLGYPSNGEASKHKPTQFSQPTVANQANPSRHSTSRSEVMHTKPTQVHKPTSQSEVIPTLIHKQSTPPNTQTTDPTRQAVLSENSVGRFRGGFRTNAFSPRLVLSISRHH
jgi:hypothetical protein